MRWLRHHSARRYGPDPTATPPKCVPYISTASRGTTPVYVIDISQGNTCCGVLSVIFTRLSSSASTFFTDAMVHIPLDAFFLSARRLSEYTTSADVTGRPLPPGKHLSGWNAAPGRMVNTYSSPFDDTSGRSQRFARSLYGRAK